MIWKLRGPLFPTVTHVQIKCLLHGKMLIYFIEDYKDTSISLCVDKSFTISTAIFHKNVNFDFGDFKGLDILATVLFCSLLGGKKKYTLLVRVTIRAIFPGRILARISILLWFKVPREHFENIRNRCHTPIGLHTQTKPNPRYFRQYRNPGQDASGKNGTYGHPTVSEFPYTAFRWIYKYVLHAFLSLTK